MYPPKVVEDDAMACFMAHVHAPCSNVSGHVASSAGVASAAVTAVAVVQGVTDKSMLFTGESMCYINRESIFSQGSPFLSSTGNPCSSQRNPFSISAADPFVHGVAQAAGAQLLVRRC